MPHTVKVTYYCLSSPCERGPDWPSLDGLSTVGPRCRGPGSQDHRVSKTVGRGQKDLSQKVHTTGKGEEGAQRRHWPAFVEFLTDTLLYSECSDEFKGIKA